VRGGSSPSPSLTVSRSHGLPLRSLLGLSGEAEGRVGDGAFDGGGAEFFEGELEAEALHDGETEIGFVTGGVFDFAVGFVNAHELGAGLEFFFGSHGGVEGSDGVMEWWSDGVVE